MLRVDRATLVPFGEEELRALIRSKGLKSILPDALDDAQLLQLSDQLRDLLSGKGWDKGRGKGSAALPMTLLLLSKAGANHEDIVTDMAMLHEVATLISIAADREVVNRTIQRRDLFMRSELMETLKAIVRHKYSPAAALSRA